MQAATDSVRSLLKCVPDSEMASTINRVRHCISQLDKFQENHIDSLTTERCSQVVVQEVRSRRQSMNQELESLRHFLHGV
jgi:hypothetical protein